MEAAVACEGNPGGKTWLPQLAIGTARPRGNHTCRTQGIGLGRQQLEARTGQQCLHGGQAPVPTPFSPMIATLFPSSLD